MSDSSARLGLPYLAAAQAQKHVTHNEGLRRLDAYVHLTLESRRLLAPPSLLPEGQCWFVPVGAGGVFTGHEGEIASWEAGAFEFLPVPAGCLAFIRDEGRVLLFDGRGWVSPLAVTEHHAAIDAHVMEEDVVLSGAYTESRMAIPDRAIVLGVSTRIMSAVTGATSYDCGVASERAKFGGSLGIAREASNAGVVGPSAYYAPTKIRLSANGGAFTGGRVRVAIHYLMCPVAEAFKDEEWWTLAPSLLDGVAPVLSADLVRERYVLANAYCSAQDIMTRSGGTKWVVGPAGTLAEVPANALAFDYASGRRRMVLEGAATNLHFPSHPTASFNSDAGRVTEYVKDDSLTGVEIPVVRISGTDQTTIYAYRSAAPVQSGVVTRSCYMKILSGTANRIGFAPATGRLFSFWYDLGTKAITLGDSTSSASVVELKNGWYRLSATSTAPAGTTVAIFIPTVEGPATPKTAIFTALQTEAGPIATSYIPTTTAAVTRVADTCALTPAAVGLVSSAGPNTLAWRGSVVAAVPVTSLIRAADAPFIRAGSTGFERNLTVVPAGSALTLGVSVMPGELGCAVGWNAARTDGAINGGAIAGVAAAVARDFSTLRLDPTTATSRLEIDELVVWPIKGSNAAIQAQARVWA